MPSPAVNHKYGGISFPSTRRLFEISTPPSLTVHHGAQGEIS